MYSECVFLEPFIERAVYVFEQTDMNKFWTTLIRISHHCRVVVGRLKQCNMRHSVQVVTRCDQGYGSLHGALVGWRFSASVLCSLNGVQLHSLDLLSAQVLIITEYADMTRSKAPQPQLQGTALLCEKRKPRRCVEGFVRRPSKHSYDNP